MLTYLINVTDDLLALSVVIGVFFAYLSAKYSVWGKRIAYIGLGTGLLGGGIRSAITNSVRVRAAWKIGMYGRIISLSAFLLFVIGTVIFSFKSVKNKAGEKAVNVMNYLLPSLAALFVAAALFNATPDVFAYPFKMEVGEGGVLSSDFLLRLGGYLLGILAAALTTVATQKIGDVLFKKGLNGALAAEFFTVSGIYAVFGFIRLLSTLIIRNYIKSQALFAFAAGCLEQAKWFTFAEYFAVIVVSVLIWVNSAVKKEPYKNNAEKRKQRSVWRMGKRFSVSLLLCFIVCILCTTWFVDLNTVKIAEVPLEEPQIVKNALGEDEFLVVPLTMVNDGHLHRFAYTVDGVTTRFIVILKQENTSNYGVGLDACEVCGEAGYYENGDGQVVCKKCGVIMNKTTIGMKGGCNPIIIEYDINESSIIVPVSEMVAHKKEFK